MRVRDQDCGREAVPREGARGSGFAILLAATAGIEETAVSVLGGDCEWAREAFSRLLKACRLFKKKNKNKKLCLSFTVGDG